MDVPGINRTPPEPRSASVPLRLLRLYGVNQSDRDKVVPLFVNRSRLSPKLFTPSNEPLPVVKKIFPFASDGGAWSLIQMPSAEPLGVTLYVSGGKDRLVALYAATKPWYAPPSQWDAQLMYT